MKKVQKHYSHVASFNAISIVTHLSMNILLVLKNTSHKTLWMSNLSENSFFFIVPFKTQDLEKTRLSIMWKIEQT